MNDKDFEINGTKFKINKINALGQFHLARMLSPLLSELLPAMGKIAKLKESEVSDAHLEFLTPIFTGVSKLSRIDSETVLFSLLSAIEIQQAQGNWAKLANANGLMFDDLELPLMLQCAGRAFMYNLGGFFNALPLASKGVGLPQSGK